MGLFVGSTPVKSVYVGNTPVTAVYVGSQKVWPTSVVVQITLGTGNEARDQLRAALSARGLNYQTVTEIPFEIELVGTGSAMGMFNGCSSLTQAPSMDTSQVTDMYYMFYNCSSLTSVPDMYTSSVTNMNGMFYGCASLTDGNVRLMGRHPNVSTASMITGSGLTRLPFDVVQITLGTGNEARDQLRAALTNRGLYYTTVTEILFDIELVGTGSAMGMFNGCSALMSVPVMDTSQVTNMNSMFWSCRSLTSVPDMDTAQVTDMSYMFRGCSSLTSGPVMDTSQVTNMSYMFHTCSSLTYVPDLATSLVTSVSNMFYGCASLTDGNVRLIGRIPNVSIYNMISYSGLTREPFYDAAGNPI